MRRSILIIIVLGDCGVIDFGFVLWMSYVLWALVARENAQIQSLPLNIVNVELGCEETFSFVRSLTYYIYLLTLCVNFDGRILPHVQ